MAAKPPSLPKSRSQLILVLCLFGFVVLAFFYQILAPGQVVFSNDGPVGQLASASHQLPARFTGCWEDLQWLLRPVLFSKLYAPLSILILGLSAWVFFREMKLSAPACVLGGLAAMLHSTFFSVACWGIAAHTLTIAMTFLALAALTDTTSPRRWMRTVLAGLCVGMGVAEGADVGALCSLFVALFLVCQAWITAGPRVKNLLIGGARLAVIAVCAALLAACAVSELVSNDIAGIAGTKQDAATRAEHWNWATQWSLPKSETLGILVPGLFGYRADSDDGSGYWGNIGRASEWTDYLEKRTQNPPADKYIRSSGSGFYSGVLVLMLAFWALVQSLWKNSVFDSTQRKWIWFWAVVGVISLLFAFGHYAPFYRIIYALPYFSTIRNPIKFLYFMSMASLALFAFGLDGLWRCYLNRAASNQKERRPGRFENLWLFGSILAAVLLVIAAIVYAANRDSLEQYLHSVQFNPSDAHLIVTFSVRQVSFFVAFFAGAVVIVNLALRRILPSQAIVIFGLFLLVDFGFANFPWITMVNYEEQNASNPILSSLQDKPYEHRVALLPIEASNGPSTLEQIYKGDWRVHQFPFYNIQTLDIVQLSRMPEDIKAFGKKFESAPSKFFRRFQLTNTRYLFCAASALKLVNDSLDPVERRFRIVERFNFTPRPGVVDVSKVWDLTVFPDINGLFAVVEFTAALPRAKLYSQWSVNTNASAAFEELDNPQFNPEQTVLVTGTAPEPVKTPAPDAGTVSITSYAPKRIELKADAATSAILLLNDRFDPNWKVLVDGQRQTLLRCNYLMRGVYLASGSHTIEFRFEPPIWPLCVSLATLAAGFVLVGFLFVPSLWRKNPQIEKKSPKRNQATMATTRK
jgi:hypothetical protein